MLLHWFLFRSRKWFVNCIVRCFLEGPHASAASNVYSESHKTCIIAGIFVSLLMFSCVCELAMEFFLTCLMSLVCRARLAKSRCLSHTKAVYVNKCDEVCFSFVLPNMKYLMLKFITYKFNDHISCLRLFTLVCCQTNPNLFLPHFIHFYTANACLVRT